MRAAEHPAGAGEGHLEQPGQQLAALVFGERLLGLGVRGVEDLIVETGDALERLVDVAERVDADLVVVVVV